MKCEFGVKQMEVTGGFSSPMMVFKHCPVAVSHMRQRPSYDALATSVPSCEKSSIVIGSECAGRTRSWRPVRTSHSRTVSSYDPEARRFDCGLNLTQKT